LSTAVITGGGSGVGRATAIALSRSGWSVALVGRRQEALIETRSLMDPGVRALAVSCDISDQDAVADMGARVQSELGDIEVLVNAAGTNAPRRSLEVLSREDYRAILDANLNGAYYCVQAFLPGMRSRGRGSIVNVISDAGKVASPKGGPAYAMSKFGLAGLTQSINAEERARGIRAIGLFPGDIDTPLLKKRPSPPDAEALAKMMRPEDVARCIVFCLELPPHVVVEEMLVRPR
jgi:NAD(P)-dependent dehydrogenase (short-subunit alcohol dehydrogenase family)